MFPVTSMVGVVSVGVVAVGHISSFGCTTSSAVAVKNSRC